ncbi:MAG TPA: hypothetical protein VFZ22_09390 [Pyrinomonadaceae bacterium]|nr:hypothetical protein [Pyrinomonadaceae bacterium]
MKSEDYQKLLEEYVNGELASDDQDRVEQELFALYDREIEVSPALWSGIEERIIPVSKASYGWWMQIAAVLILTIGLGSVYLLSRKEETPTTTPKPVEQTFARFTLPQPKKTPILPKRIVKPTKPDDPGVFSSDLAYLDIDDQDTVNHIEQTQNLLRSIRNVNTGDNDEEIDVTYDKALSQRLLNENVVLRRDAEMKAKFPTKTLLADLEPLLIDIANLPDRARPEEVREIKERVQKTEIVAALMEYRDRGINNR